MAVWDLLKMGVAAAPASMRQQAIRTFMRIDTQLPQNFTVRLAQSRDDYARVFALIHDAYVQDGRIQASSSGLHVTPHHILPGTTTVVACVSGEIVATVSIIRNGILGLPMERSFDMRPHLTTWPAAAEVSSIAIANDWRTKSGQVLFPLLKYVFQYCERYAHIDRLFVQVDPWHADVLEAAGQFVRLPKRDESVPGVGTYASLSELRRTVPRLYSSGNIARNAAAYFTGDHAEAAFQWPQRPVNKVWDPTMTPELVEEFFLRKSNALTAIDNVQLARLRTLFCNDDFLSTIPKPPDVPELLKNMILRRSSVRYDLAAPAKLADGRVVHNVVVVQAAADSVLLYAPAKTLPRTAQLRVDVGGGAFSTLTVQRFAMRGNLAAAYKIIEADPVWSLLITWLAADVTQGRPSFRGAFAGDVTQGSDAPNFSAVPGRVFFKPGFIEQITVVRSDPAQNRRTRPARRAG